MKRATSVFFSCLLLGTVWLGCSSKTEQGLAPGAVNCVANQRSLCLCANKARGTHKCNAAGNAYGKCEIEEGTPCPDGDAPPDTQPPACAGKSVAIDTLAPLVEQGKTEGASAQEGIEACGGANGAETSYTFTVPGDGGKVTATVEASGFTPILYVRASDCEGGSQVACSGAKGTPATLTFDAAAGTAYTLFVDSDGGSGTFKLTMSLEGGARCGDKIIQTGEVCDDGNKVGGDGCSEKCDAVDANAPSGYQCPGQQVHVWGPPVVATGKTNGENTANYESSFCPEVDNVQPGAGQPEQIYAVTAHKAGKMTITASDTDFENVLYVRPDCATPGSETVCVDARADTTGEKLEMPVTEGTTYSVFVDGVGDRGKFKLTFSID